MNNEYGLDTFPIMGTVSIGRIQNIRPNKTAIDNKQEAQEITLKANARKAKAKRDGKRLLKETEDTKTNTFYPALLHRNKAVQTHLIAFCNLARFALSNNWHICYGEYRKRIALKDIEKEHETIRRWLKKNTKDSYTAVSFGVGKKGYVYIYFISTSEKDLEVHDLAIAFAHYLRHKRHYIPIELKPYEDDPTKFIAEKYCDDSIQSLDEIFMKLDTELYTVMRASFALPSKHRTLKTEALETLLLALSNRVAFENIHFDYGQKDILDKTHSFFIGSIDEDTYEALNIEIE